jgi:hypothetical protein
VTPTWYVDPNAAELRKATVGRQEKAIPRASHQPSDKAPPSAAECNVTD